MLNLSLGSFSLPFPLRSKPSSSRSRPTSFPLPLRTKPIILSVPRCSFSSLVLCHHQVRLPHATAAVFAMASFSAPPFLKLFKVTNPAKLRSSTPSLETLCSSLITDHICRPLFPMCCSVGSPVYSPRSTPSPPSNKRRSSSPFATTTVVAVRVSSHMCPQTLDRSMDLFGPREPCP